MGAGACTTKTIEERYASENVFLSLDEVLERAEPLDLVVFRGNWLISEFIGATQLLGNGSDKWSHVGIVVTTDVMPITNGIPGRKYIWESNTTYEGGDESDCPNIETGKGHCGVQLRDMEETIKNYIHPNCVAGIVKLQCNPWVESANNPTWRATLVGVIGQFKTVVKDIKFTEVTLDAWKEVVLSSTHKVPVDKRRETVLVKENIAIYQPQVPKNIPDTIFCSAFCGLLYQTVGVLPLDYDCMKISPVELAGVKSNDGYFMPITKDPLLVKSENFAQ